MVEVQQDRKFGVPDKPRPKAGIVQKSLDSAPQTVYELPHLEDSDDETKPSKFVNTESVSFTNKQRREKSADKYISGNY